MSGLSSLYDLTRAALEERLAADGVHRVHAGALWRALYHDADTDVLACRDLAPPLRRWLTDHLGSDLAQRQLDVVACTASGDQRTVKYLVRLDDGAEVETVAIEYPGRVTACVSTQAGCAMGCVFCATGQMGFTRHLRAGEIVGQILRVQRGVTRRAEPLRNVVLMGMGEPLHNYDNVMQALEIVSDRAGLNIGPSRITINTVGVVPGILRLAEERRPYHLGVSLHGSTEAERSALVPVSHRWPLVDLMAACRTYCDTTGRKIFVGWTLIDGVNDTPDHAMRLTRLLDGVQAHVNLIRLNATQGYAGRASTDSTAETFRTIVQAAGIPCTIRQRRGIDVSAGCGQLKRVI
ncbi:MAG: 23S rRNA (adenine(2503)-C(2))-methyltransferase RlmN [Vicinamibacterales bacterium]